MIPRSIRRLAGTLTAVAMAATIAACSAGGGAIRGRQRTGRERQRRRRPPDCPTAQPAPLPAGETRTVTIATTSRATSSIDIEADLSPIAAGNFVALAECGFYDGVVFHRSCHAAGRRRVRDPGRRPRPATGTGGPGYTITDEPVSTRHTAAAPWRWPARPRRTRSGRSSSSSSTTRLASSPRRSANTYQIIGTVTSGMEMVDAIAAAPAGAELPDRSGRR